MALSFTKSRRFINAVSGKPNGSSAPRYGLLMRLSEFIHRNLNHILDEWEAHARGIHAAEMLKAKELRDHARQMLQTIIKDLNTPQTAQEQKEKSEGHSDRHGAHKDNGATSHGSARMLSGFTIEELVAEFRALRASVLRLWSKASVHGKHSDFNDMTRFNEAIDQAVAESVAKYSFKVRQAQNLFLGILGHDLRNPLTAIMMSAEAILQNGSSQSRDTKFAYRIHESVNEMSGLVHDLLDFTRTRLGQGMPVTCGHVNLEDVARQSVDSARTSHPESDISFNGTGDLTGYWDAARLRQVFSNLIGNAVKHGDKDATIEVVLTRQGECVIATVHNLGHLIPESDISLIFEPLHQLRPVSVVNRVSDGLGLGLYIAQQIVHAHSGRITVASSASAGTTFTIELPCQPPS